MALRIFIFTLPFVTFLIFTPALSQEEQLLLVHPFLGRPTPSSITMNLVDGIHYTCVGSAGAPWKFDRSVTGYEKWWEPSGYAWVEVEEDTVKVSFIRPDKEVASGVTMHSFSISPR